MMPIIAAQGIDVNFRAPAGLFGSRRLNVLEDVSIDLRAGETLGLVGESGSGKTTLARALLGLVPRAAGRISFEGKAIAGTGASAFRHMRRETAMMFQDPVGSLSPRLPAGSLVTEPFAIHRVAMPSRREKAKELLGLVGLPPSFADRYPHEMSGGQARRVGVARALALRPKVIIADEPTAGLDVSVQGEILNLMKRLKDEFGLSYAIVTHNLAMIRHVSDRLAIMYLGRIVEEGPTRQVFSAPLHPYTLSLIQSEPHPDPRRRHTKLAISGEVPSISARPQGCEFHTRCAFAQDRCRSEVPRFAELGPGRMARCHFPLEKQEERL